VPFIKGMTTNNTEVLKKTKEAKLELPITIWVTKDMKEKYDILSLEPYKVRMAEHMRLVMYPEIQRIWDLEMGSGEKSA
jgi:hypothetical protein